MSELGLHPILAPRRARLEWVDCAKGIGIVLVVFGHCIGGLLNTGLIAKGGLADKVLVFLYYIHMPLFFFLAGLFVTRSAQRDLRTFVLNKFCLILYPYLVWSIIEGTLQHFAAGATNAYVPWSRLLAIVYWPIDQYWFLYTIFIIYMGYWLALRARMSPLHVFVLAAGGYGIVAVIGVAIPSDVWSSVLSFSPYFGLGALLSTSFARPQSMRLPPVALCLLSVAGYVVVVVRADGALPFDVILRPFFAAAGIIATICLSILLAGNALAAGVRLLGYYSLQIYVAHTIVSASTRIFLQHGLKITDPLMHIVIGTCLGVYLPVLLARLCEISNFPYLFVIARRRRRIPAPDEPLAAA